MLIVLCLRFLYPIMLIQSQVIYVEKKMTQKLDNVLKQNVNLTNQTNSWTSLAYCSSINGTQSKHDCCNNINHQRALQIKFHGHSWLFQKWLKKLAIFERLFW